MPGTIPGTGIASEGGGAGVGVGGGTGVGIGVGGMGVGVGRSGVGVAIGAGLAVGCAVAVSCGAVGFTVGTTPAWAERGVPTGVGVELWRLPSAATANANSITSARKATPPASKNERQRFRGRTRRVRTQPFAGQRSRPCTAASSAAAIASAER